MSTPTRRCFYAAKKFACVFAAIHLAASVIVATAGTPSFAPSSLLAIVAAAAAVATGGLGPASVEVLSRSPALRVAVAVLGPALVVHARGAAPGEAAETAAATAAGAQGKVWPDAVLHRMPKTVNETKTFIEHLARLGRHAVDVGLEHEIPKMFHHNAPSPMNQSAQEEIGAVMAMLMANTHDEETSAESHRSGAPGRRRRRLASIRDAPENHMDFVWEMDWESGTVEARLMSDDERRASQDRDLREFRTRGERRPRHRAEYSDDNETVTLHFPGPIDPREHPVVVEHVKHRDAGKRHGAPTGAAAAPQRRRRLSSSQCYSGSSTYCPTTITISGSNAPSSAMGTSSILNDAPECASSKVYKMVGGGWYLYRWKSWTGLYRRWIITNSEWNARGCVYVGSDLAGSLAQSSGSGLVLYNSALSPSQIGTSSYCLPARWSNGGVGVWDPPNYHVGAGGVKYVSATSWSLAI
jgi:hypothetical protein